MSLDVDVIRDNLAYFLLGRYPNGPFGGAALTLYLALVSGAISLVGGIILGLLTRARVRLVRYAVIAFIQVLRGVPLLMVIFWMYFLLPMVLGHRVAENWTVIAALSLFTSAYLSQVVVAGIEAVPRGQREAALASGLRPWQAMVYVILPQGLRHMIPSFVNQFVSLIKDTSLAFIVGVSELTQIATQVNNRTLVHPAEIFLFVAVVYFVLCYALTSLSRRLERRLQPDTRSAH
jgi:polar amino acid transport system permease protein